jgi:post-GPI attachment to proteins factor 3
MSAQPFFPTTMHLFGRASAVVLLSAFCLVGASLGDRNWHYKGCLSTCDTERCATGIFEATKPLSLRLTGWTCMDDCKYDCMHKMTGNNIAWGQKIHQYYGKWPFWRFAGMQEPASVIFSMLNFLAHAAGLMKVRKRIPASHPMRPFYIGWAYLSMNAWLWSSVFHTRGTS